MSQSEFLFSAGFLQSDSFVQTGEMISKLTSRRPWGVQLLLGKVCEDGKNVQTMPLIQVISSSGIALNMPVLEIVVVIELFTWQMTVLRKIYQREGLQKARKRNYLNEWNPKRVHGEDPRKYQIDIDSLSKYD